MFNGYNVLTDINLTIPLGQVPLPEILPLGFRVVLFSGKYVYNE